MTDFVGLLRTIVETIEPIDSILTRYPKGTGQPYFMAGHMLEITNRLINKTADMEEKYKKYPLIILHQDVAIPTVGDVAQCNFNIIIVAQTLKFKNAEQRVEEVFKPVLYPLYDALIATIIASGEFMWPGEQTRPPHTPIDRPYYGFQSGDRNIKNKMTDPLDAIEILNLKLNKVIC